MWLLALVMLAQSYGINAYMVTWANGQRELAMPYGRYEVLLLDDDCTAIDYSRNVLVSLGSADGNRDVGMLLMQDGQSCSGLLGNLLSDAPCATNDEGDCDIDAER